MTIDTAMLDTLGDNWILRTDNDGVSYGDFQSAPVGEWTTCPRWHANTKADCESGGLFGQGPGGYGHAKAGTRLCFCETRGTRLPVDGDKIKVREFRILYTGAGAMAAALHLCGGKWPGSLALSGATLPEGFTIGNVDGSLDLSDATLPEGFTIGAAGGWLALSGATLPKGFTIGSVGGSLYLHGANLPEGFTIGNVGGWLDLSDATLPKGFTIGSVGGSLYLHGAKMAGCKTEAEIRAKITRK